MSVAKELKRQAYDRRARRSRGKPASWSDEDAVKVLEAIDGVCKRGGAVRLGYTRDGGAFAIGVYGDGEPYTEYLRAGDDIVGLLHDIAEDMEPVENSRKNGAGAG